MILSTVTAHAAEKRRDSNQHLVGYLAGALCNHCCSVYYVHWLAMYVSLAEKQLGALADIIFYSYNMELKDRHQ